MIRRRRVNRRENRVLRREAYNEELTVGRLRRILERALDQIDGWEDNDIVHTVSNTYHLGGAYSYMCADGIGFLNLSDIEVEEAWDDDDEDDEDED
jgi:hypothetical protein